MDLREKQRLQLSEPGCGAWVVSFLAVLCQTLWKVISLLTCRD